MGSSFAIQDELLIVEADMICVAGSKRERGQQVRHIGVGETSLFKIMSLLLLLFVILIQVCYY